MDSVHLYKLFAAMFLLSGCATVNFSANYYKPPQNYQAEIKEVWAEYKSHAGLSADYSMEIVSGRTTVLGIPEIEGVNVRMPEDFIKYIYQNYYDDRHKVLVCVASHEVCHNEYRLFDQSSPQAHFQVDQRAVELLKSKTLLSPEDYYKSLWVVKDYWFARKGVGGHAFNLGWNMASLASMYYGGPTYFRDWFATDLNKRLVLMRKRYSLKSGSRFQRSSAGSLTMSPSKSDCADIFLAQK